VPVLHINQQRGSAPTRHQIDVNATDIPGLQAPSVSHEIEFELTPQDGERIRWYLEDFLQFDEDPAPQIAKGVEAFMAECGEKLFRSIFEGSNAGQLLWAALAPHLSTTRIEITAGIAEATAIPWEFIRNPHTRTFLALSAQSFVRTQRAAQTALTVMGGADKVRILLVICRPRGGEDVPFRSVAGRLVTRLDDDARDAFDLDVLRPPTYEQLASTLRLAKEQGRPYHVVHFDGHGVYADPRNLASAGKVLSSLKLDAGKIGPHGFLMFENPDSETNGEFVDGLKIGALLRDSSVPFLILNACQSAFAEATAKPKEATSETRDEVEAYGSLAQAVVDAGAAGVVAMRHSVYVVTAAQFVAELYGALARGRTLGEAVTWARKNLADQPERRIAYEARPLQDWSVPVVWERVQLRLWSEKPDAAPINISLKDGVASKPSALDQALPARPDIGFFGRDETLYALDRAFDKHRTVLLHAYAGSGKTSTAAEFARWYTLTGGVEGPVLFSSFERHLPLARVLDKIGSVFGPTLEANGIHWDAITDTMTRRDIALQVLRQMPVLWIWDNVEPVTGFPAGTASDWTAAEQQELRAFLSAARETKAKFLLTSRRNEQAWLGDLARRVSVPAMPLLESLQLAGAILAQRGRRLANLPDLTPLLRFAHGNPLTILVTVGEALRVGIDTTERLDAFVNALRGGEVAFENEASEGRSMSLGASLSYGFGAAFSDDEREVLTLLHLFHGFVDVDVLRAMGNPKAEWCLEAVRGLTRERGIALLDRAAEIGLLSSHGDGYYGIHPALPWYFRALFQRAYPPAGGEAVRTQRAFVEAMGELGNFCIAQYESGNRKVASIAAAEEDNLLAAWRLARANARWDGLVSAMQGLRILYDITGRRAAWRRLVDETIPNFVDPTTDEPLTGREQAWNVVTQYRVSLAREARNWTEAERLQRMCVERDRQRANRALVVTPDSRDARQRSVIRNFAVSLHDLAQIQRAQSSPLCLANYHEALDLLSAIDDKSGQATCAFNLGNTYKNVSSLRDLAAAERWYRQSLDLQPSDDGRGRSECLGELGGIAYEQFLQARGAKRPVDELMLHLNAAAQWCLQALDSTPMGEIARRAVAHGHLGIIYGDAGDIERSLQHFQQEIRYCEQAGDIFHAGDTRYNVAASLFNAGRFPDARAYAEAALANYRMFGDRAVDCTQRTERLIALIDQAFAKKAGGT
jgi:tetratricopeptide (TPR) repeat protein